MTITPEEFKSIQAGDVLIDSLDTEFSAVATPHMVLNDILVMSEKTPGGMERLFLQKESQGIIDEDGVLVLGLNDVKASLVKAGSREV